MKEWEKRYQDNREKLKTGDIVLFGGKGKISSIIKYLTRSKWSHVGIVYRPSSDLVLLWESTNTDSIEDIESGKARKGVQLIPLSTRIKEYDGIVSVRFLSTTITGEMLHKLQTFRNEVRGRLYESSLLELIKSVYDGIWGANEEDLSSLFCSELVAESWQRMALLPEDSPSNEFTPKDFGEGGNIENSLLMGNLSEEVVIKS